MYKCVKNLEGRLLSDMSLRVLRAMYGLSPFSVYNSYIYIILDDHLQTKSICQENALNTIKFNAIPIHF